MFSPPPSEQYSPQNATDNHEDLQKHFMVGKKEDLLSYNNNNNIMLAAIISLLLVILFVLLLHLYAKWFLDRGRRRNLSSVVLVSDVLRSPAVRLHHHLNTYTNEHDISPLSSAASPSSKGLNSKAIALIPLFTYHHAAQDLDKQGLECAICLSVFEEDEVGRSLPKCCHGFHVDCIDMWLQSHSSCPICRAQVLEEEACEEHIIHTDVAGLA